MHGSLRGCRRASPPSYPSNEYKESSCHLKPVHARILDRARQPARDREARLAYRV